MTIDPNILNIVLGLITNGLGSLIALSSQKAGKLLIGERFLAKWESENNALEPLPLNDVRSVAEQVEWKDTPVEELISLFLLSPEVEEFVRQLYWTRLTQEAD